MARRAVDPQGVAEGEDGVEDELIDTQNNHISYDQDSILGLYHVMAMEYPWQALRWFVKFKPSHMKHAQQWLYVKDEAMVIFMP